MNVSKQMHGFLCGDLWDERRVDCRLALKDLTKLGQQKNIINCCIGLLHMYASFILALTQVIFYASDDVIMIVPL